MSPAADHHHPGVYSPHGVFVCFEGGEGAGKSTQSKLLRAWLESEGYPVLLTFEPGDTPVGRKVREIVLDPATGALAHRTEALLYAADKAEHVHAVVGPALQRDEVVITDRYVDSTLAYQGAGRSLDGAGLRRVATGFGRRRRLFARSASRRRSPPGNPVAPGGGALAARRS